MAFEEERAFFQSYRDRLSAAREVVDQMERALEEVHRRYDTRVWENRFVAGGVTEQIVGSSARAVGLEVANAGKQNQGYDLELPSGRGISIKAVYASTDGQIRLINNLGRGVRRWTDATVLLVADVGIGYADPDLCPNLTSQAGDALVISGRALKGFWDHSPEWRIGFVQVPHKTRAPTTAVASDVVAFDIFQAFPLLAENFRPEI